MDPKIVVDNDVVLERLKMKHVDDIFNTIISQREYLREWLPFVDFTNERKDTEEFVKYQLSLGDREFTYAIIEKTEFAGLIGLKEIDYINHKTEIGYWLSEKSQGKGLVTKSSKALINYAFNKLDINRIQLRVAVGNGKSVRVAKRLNFKEEGIERAGELHGDVYMDLHVFSLLKNEFDIR